MGQGVNGVSIFISGSTTDWLNQGDARSHSKVGPNPSNSHLCIATALLGLHEAYPSKCHKRRDTPFATWRNGENIPASYVTATLRDSAFKQGYKAESYPPTRSGMAEPRPYIGRRGILNLSPGSADGGPPPYPHTYGRATRPWQASARSC